MTQQTKQETLDMQGTTINTESTALAPRQERAVAAPASPGNATTDLLFMAFERGLTPEQIGQMMDLRDREERRSAKKAYDQAFAAFKGEKMPVMRTKKRTSGPMDGTTYAELRDWVDAVTASMSKHGLSSAWKITRDEKDWLEVTCYLRHVDGHEESVAMGGPPDTSGSKNVIQSRASTVTYLERYTLKAITGLAEGGEDNDGAGATDDQKEIDFLSFTDRMDLAADPASLKTIFDEGVKHYTTTKDVPGYQRFMAAAAARKKSLQG